MPNLLNCNNTAFTATIEEAKVSGKIRVEDGKVFLCQNGKNGSSCNDKLGYKFSWFVRDGSEISLENNSVTNFKLHFTKSQAENYKDWRVGDILTHSEDELIVIFRSGELVVCKYSDGGQATSNYTCDELYNNGWRLKYDPLQDKGIVEITINKIAEMLGVSADKVRIKKN